MSFDPVRSADKLARGVAKVLGYVVMLLSYSAIFLVAFATLGLIEIRQANMTDFNALIAKLEQRDRYRDKDKGPLQVALAEVTDGRAHLSLLGSAYCFDNDGGGRAGKDPAAMILNKPSATPPCSEIRKTILDKANMLLLTEQALLFQMANLDDWYNKYIDGMAEKSPHIIPVMRVLVSESGLLTFWARLPFEVLEMLLLVWMGALGGVISATRVFVDPTRPNPSVADRIYRPAAGGVIALAIYVLFRASQLFVGASGPGSATTVSTSIFLLAALGLASGFCANEAVAQIELAAKALLRRRTDNTDPGRPASGEQGLDGGAHPVGASAALR